MFTRRLLVSAATAAILGAAAPAYAAPIEIQWWHAMGGALGEKLVAVAEGFNKSQNEYKVVPVFKGSYPEAMTGAIAAFRAKQQPDIVQVFEVGTATMMAAKGAIYPVYQLMKDEGEKFDPKAYVSAVTGYYSDSNGNLLSFPFNSSTPIFYYNKTLFKKAGLDPEKAPKTWPEVAEAGKKLRAAGVACGITTTWPSWVNIENLSVWHAKPIATLNNGFDGLGTKLEIATPLQVKHVEALAEWQKDKVFDYGGRTNQAGSKFASQDCAMLIESSGGQAAIRANAAKAGYEFGIGMMPYWPDVQGAPQNSIIGGATLWVLKGKPKANYKGVAKFFSYLSKPEVQADWHQSTGYLPITNAAYQLTLESGFYQKFPGADTPFLQMSNKAPLPYTKGLRLGYMVQVRDVIEEELEAAFSGKKSAKAALDDAQSRGNALLRKFEQENK